MRALRLAGVVLLSVLAAACGQETGEAPSEVTPGVVTGAVSKGPLQGATVEFYQINAATGAATTLVNSAVTDSSGNFSVTGLPSELILVKTSGGSYVDESDSETNPSLRRRITFSAGDQLMAILPAGQTTLAITPYSMALYKKALNQAGGSNFTNVYAAVRTQATTAFGFDPITTIPADPITGVGGSQHYAILLGAAAVAINASATTAGHLPAFADVLAFITDFADGRLDGQSLPDAIRRFRNNNIGVYGDVSEPAVNEDALSDPAPVPNSAPVGIPTISGTPTEDLTLTADASGVSDADGLGTFSYQWRRNGTPIGGATGTSYVLVDADVGTTITVTVSYTDGGSAAESVTSNGAGPVANVNDLPAGNATISGTPTQNQTLTAVTSGIMDADGLGTFSYQWRRGGSPISTATASTYVLVQADVGQSITVTVSYTDGHGTVETLTSTGVGPVANLNDPPVINSTAPATATEDMVYTYAATVTDVDGPSATWSLAGTNTCLGASIDASTGAYTFTPAGPAPPANCVVGVQVTDGGTPVTQSTTVTITAVNDAPLINSTASTTAIEDTLYTYNATVDDADGPAPSWSLGASHTCGGTIGPTSGAFSFTPAGPVPPASCVVDVTVTDGGTSVSQSTTVTITAVNDPPTISDMVSGSILEDSNTGSLDYTIGDGETPLTALTFAATSANTALVPNVEPTNISYADDGDGNGAFRDLTLTPGADQYGSTLVTVTVTDGDSATATDTFTLTVDPVSDAPSSQTFGVSTNENTGYIFATAEFNFSDAVDTNGDGSDVDSFDAVIINSLPLDGTLVLNDGAIDNAITVLPAPAITATAISMGRFKFIPDAAESGIPYTSFTFQVQDTGSTANGGVIASIPYTLSVDVLPAGPGPESVLAYVTAAGELKLFDPLDPANPVLLETGLPALGFKGRTLMRADLTAGVASNIRPARFVYIKDDGSTRTLWKVNLESAQSRTPVQVSNVTDICDVNGRAEDFANPDNTIVRVDTAGADGICDNTDDFTTAQAYLVPLTTAATAPGVPIGLGRCCGIGGIADGTGALTGVLTTEDDGTGSTFSLVRRNVGALGTPVAIADLDISGTGQIYAQLVRGLGGEHVYVRARRTSVDGTYKLLRFNVADNTLTALYDFGVTDAANLSGQLDDSAYDGAAVFFTNADRSAILALPHAATGPGQETVLATLPAGNQVEQMEQAADRIVYQAAGPNGGVYAVPKAGGGVTALAANDATPTVANLSGTNGGRVFINRVTGTTPDFVARAVDADGANVSDVTDAQWAGESYQPSCDFNVNCEDNIPAQAVFLRHGASGNLADIELVNPVTGAATGNFLPQITNVSQGQAAFGFGFGRFAQFTFFSVVENTDIWLADTQALTIELVSNDTGGDDYWAFEEDHDAAGSPTDSDGDFLSDDVEASLGTNPNNPDTDGDGLSDFEEVNQDGNPNDYTVGIDTDPNDFDTDNDGMSDGEELAWFPIGNSTVYEPGSDTNPFDPDSDNDDVGDGIEASTSSDPLAVNPVYRVDCSAPVTGNDGGSWTDGAGSIGPLGSNADVLPAIGAGGLSGSSRVFVLYAAGTCSDPLNLTGATFRSFVGFVGSVGPGIYEPIYPPTTTFAVSPGASAIAISNADHLALGNIEVMGGNTGTGGGVLVNDADGGVTNVALHSMFIHGNGAADGGGIAVTATSAGASLEVNDSEIVANGASAATLGSGRGGGIYATGPASLFVKDSRVRGNSAINTAGANPTHGGGGIYAENGASVSIENTLIADNTASNGPGGGINFMGVGQGNVRGSMLLSNSATRPGAGLHLHVEVSATSFDISNNLIVGNASTDGDAHGAGMEIEHNLSAPLIVSFNTIAYNQSLTASAPNGAGLTIAPVTGPTGPEFRNNIVAFNNDADLAAEALDNAVVGTPGARAGNNVLESNFTGNSASHPSGADPLFVLGFYLDQFAPSASVDTGDGLANDANNFAGGFYTTNPAADPSQPLTADQGTVDSGFHHAKGSMGPVSFVSSAAAPFTAGCPSAKVFLTPETGNGPVGPGHLVVAANLSGQGALSSITNLQPLGAGSVIAVDEGTGTYRLDLGGSASGGYALDVFVDGVGPFSASFFCS